MDFLKPLSIPAADLPVAFDEVTLWSARFGVMLLEHIPIKPESVVLDVGCGTGFPALELAAMLGPGSQITGIDIWKEGLERAVGKAVSREYSQVRFLEMDAHELTFPDHHFDLVVSNVGVNNFTDPRAVFKQLQRVLKPGGILSLTTNPCGHMHEFYVHFEAVLRRHQIAVGLLDRNQKHRLSEAQLRDFLGRSGFAITRVVQDQFRLRSLDGRALFRQFLIRIGFLDSWRACVPREKERAVFNDLEEVLNHQADQDGELLMTVPMLYVEAKA